MIQGPQKVPHTFTMVMSLSAKIFSVTLFPLVSVVSNEGNFSLPASVPAEAVLPSFAEEAADDEPPQRFLMLKLGRSLQKKSCRSYPDKLILLKLKLILVLIIFFSFFLRNDDGQLYLF